MKNQFGLVKYLAAVAVTGGMVCIANHANAQAAGPEPTVSPERVGSMAPVGTKPSKAEREKAEASGEQASTATTTAATKAPAGAAGQLSDADRQFMMTAARDGMKEVHMGQMAAQQGQSPEVKKLGQMIAADHTKANEQLMAIATKKGVKPDTKHKMDKMSKRDMANFDQAWLGMMVNDHQKDIAAFQRQAQQGADADLKNYAKKTLPVLQKHLKAVQAAQKKIGSGAANPAGTTDAGSAGTTGSTAKAGR